MPQQCGVQLCKAASQGLPRSPSPYEPQTRVLDKKKQVKGWLQVNSAASGESPIARKPLPLVTGSDEAKRTLHGLPCWVSLPSS